MRTIVDIPENQIQALKRLSESKQLSRAELMRRAVAEFLSRHQPAGDDEAFGAWMEYKIDSLTYQEQARAEWDK